MANNSLNGYSIVAEENGGFSVYKDGNKCDNAKGAMREIAILIGFEVDSAWTTRQLGAKLLRVIHDDKPRANCICAKNNDVLEQVRSIVRELQQNDIDDNVSFSLDKSAISHLFELTNNESRQDIHLRLTVIDSMYSTQMTRRYYGLEELSSALYVIKQNNNSNNLAELFETYLADRNIRPFKYTSEEENEETDLFSEKYGIGKDGTDKGIALSLISKYAYFATKGVFPIYDSIACDMIPRMWKSCEFPGKCPSLSDNANISGAEKLNRFLNAIDDFKTQLGIQITNDQLDRMLWYVGKIIRGNLSLILNRKDYKWCSDNGYITKDGDETSFHIENANLEQLLFLKEQPLLGDFFKLAKTLK